MTRSPCEEAMYELFYFSSRNLSPRMYRFENITEKRL